MTGKKSENDLGWTVNVDLVSSILKLTLSAPHPPVCKCVRVWSTIHPLCSRVDKKKTTTTNKQTNKQKTINKPGNRKTTNKTTKTKQTYKKKTNNNNNNNNNKNPKSK